MNNLHLVILLTLSTISCKSINNSKLLDGKIFWDGNYTFDNIIGHSYYYEFQNTTYKIVVKTNDGIRTSETVVEEGQYIVMNNSIELIPKIKLITDVGTLGNKKLVVPYQIGPKEKSLLLSIDTLNSQQIKDYEFNERQISLQLNKSTIELQDTSKLFSIFTVISKDKIYNKTNK